VAAASQRRILATTRDYVVSGGGYANDDGFTSLVVLALGTRLGSCLFFPEFGSRLHLVQTADERGRKLAEKYAWEAIAHLESLVDGLKVEASLTPYDSREPKRAGAIYLQVSGKRGATTLTALYTASVGS
jgi:phage gp46-like protein